MGITIQVKVKRKVPDIKNAGGLSIPERIALELDSFPDCSPAEYENLVAALNKTALLELLGLDSILVPEDLEFIIPKRIEIGEDMTMDDERSEITLPDPYEMDLSLPEPCRTCQQRDVCDVWERSACQIINPDTDPMDI